MAYPFKLRLPGLDSEISLSNIKSLDKEISSTKKISSISQLLEFIISDTILSSKSNKSGKASEGDVNLDFLRKAKDSNTPEGQLFELVKPILTLAKKETNPQNIIDFFENGTEYDPTGKFHTSGSRISKLINSDIFKTEKGVKLLKPESILGKKPFWGYFNNVKNLDFFKENPDDEPQDLRYLSTSKAKAYFNRILRSVEGENISPEDTRDIIRDVLNGYSKQDRENDTVFKLTIPDLKLLNGDTEDVSMFLNLENLPIDDLTAFNAVNSDGTLKTPKRLLNLLKNNKEIIYRFISSGDASSYKVLKVLPLVLKVAEQQGKLDTIETSIVNPNEYPEPGDASASVNILNSGFGGETPFTLGGREAQKYMSSLVNAGTDGNDLKGYASDVDDRIRVSSNLFKRNSVGNNDPFRRFLFNSEGERFENLYLDYDIVRILNAGLNGDTLSDEDKKKILTALIVDPSSQKIRIRDRDKSPTREGYGFTYEHVVPVNVIEKIFNFIDQQDADESSKDIVKDKVKEKLHKVGWLLVDNDAELDTIFKDTIPNDLQQSIGLNIPPRGEATKINDDDTLEDIYNNIDGLTDDQTWGRYTSKNIKPMIPLSDVFAGSKEIKVPGIKRSDLQLSQDTVAEGRLEESKKPVLTNILFGYYG
tara:strand:- start:16 stop:1962 length:1947 start_codon:yes stop_codon:yes gene_type:complete